MANVNLEEEFKKKYIKYYPYLAISSALMLYMPVVPLLFPVARQTLSILSKTNFIIKAASYLLPLGANYIRSKNEINRASNKYQKIIQEFGIKGDSDNERLFDEYQNLNSFSVKEKRRFLEKFEAEKMYSEDLYGELIRLQKGFSKKAFIFVSGFRSEPYEILQWTKYLRDFEDVIGDANFFIYVWDTRKSFISWKAAKRNTYLSAKSLFDSIEYYLPEFNELIIISHSLGCLVTHKTFSYRYKVSKNVKNVYFMGAAISQNDNFKKYLEHNYNFELKNCYSKNDKVLKYLYRGAENLDKSIGQYGMLQLNNKLINFDCSSFVNEHSQYFENLEKIVT